ncbi:MAG: tyrosine-type recombinase/integrase [Acidobacteriota bacterium]|nr:tyrosine-type recombinase/integrase [Acidobacteriota bacterium]
MNDKSDVTIETALVTINGEHLPALHHAIRLWADSSTSADSARRADLLRDKQAAITAFFSFIKKHPGDVTPFDVKAWQAEMQRSGEGKRGLLPASIYVRTSFLSSFYAWVMRHPDLGRYIRANPALLARPKAPRSYQTESVKSWTDDELQKLMAVVRRKAETSDLVGKRDLALLLLYLATGMRREEIISLRGRDIRVDETLVITGKVKGGNYRGREVDDPEVKVAVLDYLRTAGRLHALKSDAPLWTRHDPAGRPGAPLSSHSFAKNLKRYANAAGIGHVHLHQTRHTFARIVSEETGSITETQDALDHKNPQTTRVYVQRISVKKDKHSRRISQRYNPITEGKS